MSEVKTLQCNGCGKLRLNDSNHWLQGAFVGDAIVITRTNIDDSELHRFRMDRVKINHFCGEACANKWAAGELSSLRNEEGV